MDWTEWILYGNQDNVKVNQEFDMQIGANRPTMTTTTNNSNTLRFKKKRYTTNGLREKKEEYEYTASYRMVRLKMDIMMMTTMMVRN